MTGGTPVAGETLPGAGEDGDDGADRVVCHVDMDCVASCERLRHDDLVNPCRAAVGRFPTNTDDEIGRKRSPC